MKQDNSVWQDMFCINVYHESYKMAYLLLQVPNTFSICLWHRQLTPRLSGPARGSLLIHLILYAVLRTLNCRSIVCKSCPLLNMKRVTPNNSSIDVTFGACTSSWLISVISTLVLRVSYHRWFAFWTSLSHTIWIICLFVFFVAI